MVMRARQISLEELKYKVPMATGTLHALARMASGNPIDDAAILTHLANGQIKGAIESVGMPAMADYFTSPPPTNAQLRAYLTECCRRWLAMLEAKP